MRSFISRLLLALGVIGLVGQPKGAMAQDAATGLAIAAKTLAARAQAGSPFLPQVAVPPAPLSTAWGVSTWAPTIATIVPDTRSPVGSIGLTAEQLFDRFSSARSAPGATYCVNNNAGLGSDGNDCLTAATACKNIFTAQGKCNTSGVSCRIYVAAVTAWHTGYPRQAAFNGGTNFPTVDTALIATGGRVNVGTWDEYTNPSADGTYTACYSWAVTNVDQVLDTTRINAYGNYQEFTVASTAAQASALAGGGQNAWALVSGTITVCRADRAAVTFKNTRVLRSGVSNLQIKAQVSVYLGGDTATDGWDVEGGDNQGVVSTNYSSLALPGAYKAIVLSNVSMKYNGGVVNTNGRGFSVDSLHGLAACYNCRADANGTDAYSLHRTLANGAISRMVTVNVSGYDNGRGATDSRNCLTAHEDGILIDVGGVCQGNRGGSIRSVGPSMTWLVGTVCRDDLGDLTSSVGVVPATCVSAGLSAATTESTRIWLDRVKIDMPGATYAVIANPGTTIFTRNLLPLRQPAAGAGSVQPY